MIVDAISLRLPEDLERQLSDEARLSGLPRSQVMRQALEDLISRREYERFVARMIAAAKALAAAHNAHAEALAVAADFLPAENEALEQAEGAGVRSGWRASIQTARGGGGAPLATLSSAEMAELELALRGVKGIE